MSSTEHDDATGALSLATPSNGDFAGRVAFAHSSEPPRSATADRAVVPRPERLVRRAGGALAPRALTAASAPVSIPARHCRSELALAPGETRRLVFVLGQGADRDEARAL